jgi:hypothetical protein
MTDGPTLEELFLHVGDRVRYQRNANGRWHEGVVSGRERDGSIGLHDDKGAFRALTPDRLHVLVSRTKGPARWQPVTQRASATEQLTLL